MPALSVVAWPMMIGPAPQGVPVTVPTLRRVKLALLASTKPPENVFAVLPVTCVFARALLIMIWVLRVGPSVMSATSAAAVAGLIVRASVKAGEPEVVAVEAPVPAPLLVMVAVATFVSAPMVTLLPKRSSVVEAVMLTAL